ncbi:MAG: response regulator transcription factor [Acidobacteriota bacterium]|nr:response regulator transcription factor [Acidobacteriota bacterium]
MRILVVEDEPDMASILRRGLEEEGHSVILCGDGRAALTLASQYELDAVILDVMLPGIDGFAVARRLRESRATVPILMLTARDTVPDMIRGLDTGADDYLTKPFSFDLLLARLRALTRRGGARVQPVLEVGGLRLDPATREVSRDGRKIGLTKTEYAFLELLMRCAGYVVTRQAILDSVWGFEGDVENNTIDAFARLLRQKVDTTGESPLIHTVRGVGYMLQHKERA